jgi:hypothetical protein
LFTGGKALRDVASCLTPRAHFWNGEDHWPFQCWGQLSLLVVTFSLVALGSQNVRMPSAERTIGGCVAAIAAALVVIAPALLLYGSSILTGEVEPRISAVGHGRGGWGFLPALCMLLAGTVATYAAAPRIYEVPVDPYAEVRKKHGWGPGPLP